MYEGDSPAEEFDDDFAKSMDALTEERPEFDWDSIPDRPSLPGGGSWYGTVPPDDVGEPVKMAAIQDQRIGVLGFRIADSQYEPDQKYATIYFIDPNGTQRICHSGAKYVMEDLEKRAERAEVPFKATILKLKSKAGREFWKLGDPT
jgi:hypothetical protein